MKVHCIDFFRPTKSQQYGVLEAFTQGLKEALQRQGVESSIIDDETGVGRVMAKLLKDRAEFTAGFNVVVPKKSHLEPLCIPHIALIVDSASDFPELLQDPEAFVGFVDEDSVGFFKKLGSKNAFYFPHAIDKKAILHNAPKDRLYDVVMCGSFIHPDTFVALWREKLSDAAVECLLDLAERVLRSDSYSFLQAYFELIEQHGAFERELIDRSINYYDLLNSLDQYIRNLDRKRIVEAIERPVHIFGAQKYELEWQKCLKDEKKLIFHDSKPFSELSQLFSESYIVINSFPMFKRGLHERLLLALASGASVLGSKNLAVQNSFPKSLGRLDYLSPNYQEANSLIEKALKNDSERLNDVFATHDIILQNHTWDVRAKELINIVTSGLIC